MYIIETKLKTKTHIDAIYSLDFETDPFKFGRIPKPFVCEIYNGAESKVIWEENPERMNLAIIDYLESELEFLQETFRSPKTGKFRNMYIYAHNGGKFDFFFMLPLFRNAKLKLIGSRLAEAKLADKPMIFRDSFCIIPTALANAGDKFIFDYRKMEKGEREKHREEILTYLHQDVVVLGDMVYNFAKSFGFKLTIASTGMNVLTDIYPQVKGMDYRLSEFEHDHWASKVYFGGHVECFQSGEVKPKHGGKFYVYDYNSMYPYVMQEFWHPLDNKCEIRTEKGIMRQEYTDLICEDTFFVNFDGMLNGCVPVRNPENHCIDYPHGYVKRFTISIHEYKIAVKYGYIKVDRINYTENFKNKINFKEFVNRFYTLRKECKESGDAQMALFYKFILNSPYGKFALDPRKYGTHYITEDYTDKEYYLMLEGKASVVDTADGNHFMVIEHGEDDSYAPGRKHFYNVITAASITAAARSVLMEGLAWAINPVYCDTDSIICEGLKEGHPLRIHKSELGALDTEAQGDVFYCAGKKMYALFEDGNCVKMASKGMNLKPDDAWAIYDEMKADGKDDAEIWDYIQQWKKNHAGNIIKRVAMGDSVVSRFDSPTLSVTRGISFTSRTVRNTAKIYRNKFIQEIKQ